MFSQTNTQDLLLQNQSMRLVEESLEAGNLHAVELAKVRYLQSVLPTPIIGTAGVVVMFYLMGSSLNRPIDLMVWIILGLLATLWRVVLLIRHKNVFHNPPPTQVLRSYLAQTTLTAVIAGMTFGWGWLKIYTFLSPEIQMGFLFTNIVMLFGGLYAYSPHLPAYVSFSLFSLGPALWQVRENSTIWLAQTVGISLVVLVSQMFAFRWAQNFRHNVLLQEKNAKLLTELTEKKNLAEKATLAKSRFLASVSHDLRQPLHAINLYLAVLKRSTEITSSHDQDTLERQELTHSSVHHLQESATQLTLMFEALLDISKLDADSTKANIVYVSVGTLVKQLSQEYTQVAAQTGLTLDVRLPAKFEQIQVLADAIMLERVLRNLLTNATTHTLKGGVRLHLKVKHQGESNRLEFRVIDTGPGINLFDRTRIFEEFYQTDAARKRTSKRPRTSRNLGLGLAISARLATLLNTKIRLHTYLGKGSVFAFDLAMQYRDPQFNTSIPQNTQIEKRVAETCLKDVCIAVVDDEPSILVATQKLLQIYGASVLTALNTQQTWQAIDEFSKVPDIFLIDYGLGTESGLDLVRLVQQRYGKNAHCILITGDTSVEELLKFNQEKQQVLHKPLSDAKLIQAILDALGRKIPLQGSEN